MTSNILSNKYTVTILKNENVVDHLPKEKTGKYAKMIFYSLKSDPLCICKVNVTGKRVNLGDNKGMRIPCLLRFSGPKDNIQLLGKLLKNNCK